MSNFETIFASNSRQEINQSRFQSLDIALFNVAASIRRKYVHKANLHVFLRRPAVLHHMHQTPVRIDVYERFVNGTVRQTIILSLNLLPFSDR
jgi:hypothetical protein